MLDTNENYFVKLFIVEVHVVLSFVSPYFMCCLVFWILSFDCSSCLLAWYFYIFKSTIDFNSLEMISARLRADVIAQMNKSAIDDIPPPETPLFQTDLFRLSLSHYVTNHKLIIFQGPFPILHCRTESEAHTC